MDENKGKGRDLKAPSDQQETASTSDHFSQNSSLLSRIAASAEGLTRNAFSPPNSTEVNSALSNSEKGQSSGATLGISAPGESSQTFPPDTQQRDAGNSSTFRAGHNEKHVRQSEAEFSDFLDGIDTFKPSQLSTVENVIAPTSTASRSADDPFNDAWLRSQNDHAPSLASRTIAEQELRDGEDVLALLSDPTAFDYEQFEVQLEEDENYDWGLSSEQLTQLRAMTRELFPAFVPHRDISAEHPLNLIPQFDISTSNQLMGHSNLDAMGQWRDQWEGVLTRYTDEVWGGLLPLVKKARQEAEDLKEYGTEHVQPKALRRLEAILGHLQKR